MTVIAKKRVDILMVEQGLSPSRTKAKELIEKQLVERQQGIGWTLIQQASEKLDCETVLRLKDDSFLKYVSRAGHKLEGALDHIKLSPKGFKCLDLGASTGGFTDCLLQKGASEVYCVDVGSAQLHGKLNSDARVHNFEGLNIKDLPLEKQITAQKFDLVVIDLSFISIFKILDIAVDQLATGGKLLSLIKPQFEVGSVNIGKGGIVKSEEAKAALLEKCHEWAKDYKHQVFASQLPGRDGNQEYFLYLEI